LSIKNLEVAVKNDFGLKIVPNISPDGTRNSSLEISLTRTCVFLVASTTPTKTVLGWGLDCSFFAGALAKVFACSP
jgi:hypothetical protein